MTRRRPPLPRALAPLAALAALLFTLPLLALLVRAPWREFLGHAATPAVLDALGLSLQCSLQATALTFVLGLPLAVWLAHGEGALRALARTFALLPVVLPPVVGGVALLLAFGQNGVIGKPLAQAFGIVLPFSAAGVTLAETYVAMPFFVLTVEGALRARDRRFEEAAASLGASPWRVFKTVTLPLLWPHLRVGLLVAWARAIGEFGATITFAGSLEGETRTLPLAVYAALEQSPEAAIALSLLLAAASCTLLFTLRRRWMVAR